MPGNAHPRVIMLTTYDADEYVFSALQAGASGFLLKDATADDLVHAVRVVADGDALLSPSVTQKLIADYAQRPRRRVDIARVSPLTERELEVMRLVARGLSNAEIAEGAFCWRADGEIARLAGAEQTRAADRTQIVVAAYEAGVVRVGE